MTTRRLQVQVFGPAYLDRVVTVDRPLAGAGRPPLDQSVDGAITFGPGLKIHSPDGPALSVDLPPGWPGPTGDVVLDRPLHGTAGAWPITVRGITWHDDLGGMGAGFAAALGGELVSALGSEDDPMSRAVADRLRGAGVPHRPVRVPERTADWTLLLTSGPFGDKLPIGFRGCHAAVRSLAGAVEAAGPCDLRVVAALPNRLAAEALRAGDARVRLFAPSMRNMADRGDPVSRFVGSIDILCCNRHEWETLEDREQVAWQVSILAVTDGAAGSVVRFTTPEGEVGRVELPAFPRSEPPRDTNRAGEAYAATLVDTLLENGWSPGVSDPALVRMAAERASVAAALVIDDPRFGFPTAAEVDSTLRLGRVAKSGGGDSADPRYNAPVR